MTPCGHLRLLIADDHVPFASSLEALLSSDDSLEVVGVAHDGVDAVDLAASLEPDLVLMDVDMPRLDGIQAAERIKERSPCTRILIVTGTARSETPAAAESVILKARIGDELMPAIRAEAPT
jgi:DNA-binding NarL/FixJ family response regulator